MGCTSSKQASPAVEPVPMAKPVNYSSPEPLATPEVKPPTQEARPITQEAKPATPIDPPSLSVSPKYLSPEEEPTRKGSPKSSYPVPASKGKRTGYSPNKSRSTAPTVSASTNDTLLQQAQIAVLSTLDTTTDKSHSHPPSVDPAPSTTTHSGNHSYGGGHSSYSGGHHQSSYSSGGGDGGGSSSYGGGDSGGY